jgi:hypothetical protein
MIIKRSTARTLISKGRAAYFQGNPRDSLTTTNAEGIAYVIVNRWDCQRVDHYRAEIADFRREK